MCKPASSIGGPLGEAVMVERVAVAANSEFLDWLLRKRSRRGQSWMRAARRVRRARFGLPIGGLPESIVIVLSRGCNPGRLDARLLHDRPSVLPPPFVERPRRRGLYPLARSGDDDRHAACRRGGDRLLRGRVPGMERQIESAPVYREQEPPTQILVRAYCLFRRHVDVLPGPIAGADLDEGEIERTVRRSCRLEAIEVSAVAAEEHAMARTLHDPGRPERAVASQRIPPRVVAGGCGDELEVPDPDGFSPVELGDLRRWDRPGLEVGAGARRGGARGDAGGRGGP